MMDLLLPGFFLQRSGSRKDKFPLTVITVTFMTNCIPYFRNNLPLINQLWPFFHKNILWINCGQI